MEKELFLSTLKEKAQVDNLSDRTYQEVATLLHPQFVDDSKITDESWAVPVQILKTMSGQLRHDISTGIATGKSQWENEAATAREKAVADALKKAKEEWEKTNKTNDPAPKQEPQATDIDAKVASAVDAAFARFVGEESEFGKMSKQFKDYMKTVAEEKKALRESDIRQQIRSRLIGRGVDEDDYALEITMEKLAIGENPDVEALFSKAEKDYEAIYKRMHKNDGTEPYFGSLDGEGTKATGAEAWLKGRNGMAEREAAAAEARRKMLQ